MMMQEDTGACMSIQGYAVMRGSSQGHAKVYNGIQEDTLDCREETYLVEHGELRREQHGELRGDSVGNITAPIQSIYDIMSLIFL